MLPERKQKQDILARYQAVLLELAKTPYSDIETAIRRITELDAQTLEVERVSYWTFNAAHTAIVCQDLYRLSCDSHEAGFTLEAEQYPHYFQALEECRTLAAADARNDPRTCEFSEGYLMPFGITSMLDVPVRKGGQMVGIVCHEHTGSQRQWPIEEQSFGACMADMIAMAIQASERQEAETKLARYTAELERSNKDLEQFAYVASHDLQEPLRKIITFGSRLREIESEGLSEKACDYIERMERAAMRMRQLVGDLLEYSRVTSKQIEFEDVDLNTIMQSVLADLEMLIGHTKARFEVGKMPTIKADNHRMQELFQNLLSNALKFRRKEEPPYLRIECDDQEKGWVTVTIKDNGIGMEPQYLDQIFNPFCRLHPAHEYEGTGIGLAICQRIVRRHGGDIKVSSCLGKGSDFVLRLPREPLREMS